MDSAARTAEGYLRMLLQEQVTKLRSTLAGVETIGRLHISDISARCWQGRARTAYDREVHRVRTELDALERELSDAIDHSGRAIQSLGHRVG